MAVINKYGLHNFWVLSSGGHEWANWRRCLPEPNIRVGPEQWLGNCCLACPRGALAVLSAHFRAPISLVS